MPKTPFHSSAFQVAALLFIVCLIPSCSIIWGTTPGGFPDYAVFVQKGCDPATFKVGDQFRLKQDMFVMHDPADLVANKNNWCLFRPNEDGAPTIEDYQRGETRGARLVRRNTIITITAIKAIDGSIPRAYCSVEGASNWVATLLMDHDYLNNRYDYDRKLFSRIGGTERR